MNPYKQAWINSTNKHTTVDTAIHIHSCRDRQQYTLYIIINYASVLTHVLINCFTSFFNNYYCIVTIISYSLSELKVDPSSDQLTENKW